MTASHGKRDILRATCGAAALAAALLVIVVLPAEYGWDPLGTGATLGLLGMADDEVKPLHMYAEPWHSDAIEFQLAPYEAVEYKYRLGSGAALLYKWRADGELLFDMHAEPDGAAAGYSESFVAGRGVADTGSYVAPFAGIHGWFWQNRGATQVTLTLRTSGFYREAVELRDDREFRYNLKEE